MRADRLVAALLTLQARGRVTAVELATELEVSVATARRDLEALSAAGLPVYSQAGRGGGWQLLGEGRTDLSGLSADEVEALFLLVGPTSRDDPRAKAALRKLVRALPETFRAQAIAAAESTVVDLHAWNRGSEPTVDDSDDLVRTLQRAVMSERRVQLRYEGWGRPETAHLVDPWRVVRTRRAWYLQGGVEGVAKAFRVDRIREVVLTEQQATRPTLEEIDAAWALTTGAVRARTSRARAIIRASPTVVAWLRTQLPSGSVNTAGDDVTVTAPTADVLARALIGWADEIKVLEPPEIRAEILRLGQAAVAGNAPA